MRSSRLQDTVSRGIGRAAAAAGQWCDAYRPAGPHDPLALANRFLRLPALFSPPSGFAQPAGFGASAWTGLFDAALTRPGDFLLRPSEPWGGGTCAIWFIAAKQHLLPVLCIRATRIVDFHRAAPPPELGLNPYGASQRGTAIPLATGWPASVLAGNGSGLDLAGLPTDTAPSAWAVLLPAIPGVLLRAGDRMTDDLGRVSFVSAAELTDLGWRLQAKQTTT